jgi:L-galactose dehydrogenase
VNETLPALNALKARGLVRHVGITGLPLGVFPYVLDRAPPGSVDVVLSYCHYCLNDTSLAGLVPYLRSKGVGVISASPLSMGLLTPQGPPSWHPAVRASRGGRAGKGGGGAAAVSEVRLRL